MKPHLPVLLRKAVLACLAAVAGVTLFCGSVASADNLTLGSVDSLTIDYAEVDSILNLKGGTLHLNGDTILRLVNCGNGDGKTYTLATGVFALVDAQGNTMALDSTNNSISNYFDTTRPGTGFWAAATLQLTKDGTLQLVRHSETVSNPVKICTPSLPTTSIQYHKGVAFLTNVESDEIVLHDNGCVMLKCEWDADDLLGYFDYQATPSNPGYHGYHTGYAPAMQGNSLISLNNNGRIEFSGHAVMHEVYYAYGSAIYGGEGCKIELNNNNSVEFSGNTANSNFYGVVGGSAIYGAGDITLSNNGSVEFVGNTASSSDYYAYGGAISGASITLSNNGSVTISGNTASSYGHEACGGAIYGGTSSTIELSNNGSVTFSGNTASSYGHEADGGAIYGSTIELSNNGSVTFSGNAAALLGSENNAFEGGAIYGNAIKMNNNGSVIFSDNSSAYAGGAIYGSTIELIHNNRVAFNGNTVLSPYDTLARGGAMASSVIILRDNGSVEFNGNTASCTNDSYHCVAYGGAICGYGDITLSNNSSVTFIGNSASSSYDQAFGGAIDGAGDITLSNNGSVVFSGNTASSSSYSAYGGAISGEYSSTIMLSNNGSVVFRGNTASSSDSSYGGAIRSYGDLSIRNNDSVLFEKNVEKSGSSYRLRSIYAGGSGDVISLSAAAGKSIEFRDSMYVNSGSIVNLNEDYGDAPQAGDIVFTGLTTESDLYIVKGNVAGTAEEIRDSRTTEVQTVAKLHNGRLIIKEGAIWSGVGITVVLPQNSASKPTLLLQNGSLSGYAASASTTQQCVVTICSGAAFEAAGKSKIEQTRLVLESGSVLTFNIAAHNKDTAVLTMGTGSSLEQRGALTLQLKGDNSMEKGEWYNVLTDGAEDALDISHTSITIESGSDGWEVDKDDLRWVGSTLQVYFDGFIQPTIEFNPDLDRNQQEVYDTVKDIMADGNPGGVLGLLGQEIVGSRDEAALKRALDEISGREYATIMSSQVEGNLGHLRRLRAAAGMGTPLGEYVTFSCCYPSNKGVDKSDNKGATEMMAPNPVLDSRRIRAGVSAFHEQAELDADSNGEGFERSETGAQLTMEYLVSNDFVFGMGLSHSRTKLTPTFGKRRDEDNTHFDLFGVYRSGRWSSTTSAGLGLHQHELGRTVSGMQTQAEADGLSVNFMQELAYSVYADEEQGLQVFGSVESSLNQVDDFSETGAGNASLCVEEQDAWVTDVTLGLRYNHTLPALGNAPAGMFSVQGGVVASLGDTEPEATLRFAGAPGYSYKQYAAERSRWGYSVGASVNMLVSARTAVFGTAEAVLRNNAYTVDAQVGLKMAF